MKIHIDLPWGGAFHFEKEPMDDCMKLALGVGVFIIGFILTLGFVMR